MNVILSLVKWQYELAYIDNSVVISPSQSDPIAIARLCQVLKLMMNAGVLLKLKKCVFFTNIIDFFGNVVRPRWLEIAFHKSDEIKGLKALRDITELRSLLGLCSVSGWFISEISTHYGTIEPDTTEGPLKRVRQADWRWSRCHEGTSGLTDLDAGTAVTVCSRSHHVRHLRVQPSGWMYYGAEGARQDSQSGCVVATISNQA